VRPLLVDRFDENIQGGEIMAQVEPQQSQSTTAGLESEERRENAVGSNRVLPTNGDQFSPRWIFARGDGKASYIGSIASSRLRKFVVVGELVQS
jgi:hypothetical protein